MVESAKQSNRWVYLTEKRGMSKLFSGSATRVKTFSTGFRFSTNRASPSKHHRMKSTNVHRAFGRECIDLTYGAVEPVPQVIMIPDRIAGAMNWERPQDSAAEWTGKETWRSIKPKDGD